MASSTGSASEFSMDKYSNLMLIKVPHDTRCLIYHREDVFCRNKCYCASGAYK